MEYPKVFFNSAYLRRKKLTDSDGKKHLWYVLYLDGDVFYSRSYAGIMHTFLEILTRDCLPGYAQNIHEFKRYSGK